MAYIEPLGNPEDALDLLRASRSQLGDIIRAYVAARRLERRADAAAPGFDLWPVDADANAALQAPCDSLWTNVLANIGAASSEELFRYKYNIKPGRPASYLNATVYLVDAFVGLSTVRPNAGSPFAEVVAHATQGDRVTLRWTNSEGLVRELTGLVVESIGTGGELCMFSSFLPTSFLDNGAFSTSPDTDWTWGANWALTAGKAVATAAATALSQAMTGLTVGAVYRLAYTVSDYSAGTLRPSLVGAATQNATDVTADGTYTFDFVADQAASTLSFAKADATALSLKLDNISFSEILPTSDTTVEVELEATYVP